MRSDVEQFQSSMARLAANGADSRLIADTAVATWRAVHAELSPIIGQRGVAALFKRSVSLTVPAYDWLDAVRDGTVQPGDFTILHAAMSQQSTSNGVAANGALLQKFVDLLTKLIGESLTARLLRPVWDIYSSDGTVQEITP
jgi:hypothetical protein